MSYTEQDIQTALTRELTDERVAVAAAYWLDASPHERWEPDGIILARYARYAMAEIERLRAERDGYYNNAKYTEAAFHEVTRLRAELEKWEAEARLQYRLHNEMIEKERECREKLNQALEALEWIRDAGTDYQSISKARQALQSIRGDAP